MLKDPPKEPAAKRAERRWRNHQLTKKLKEGKLPVSLLVDPECIDWENNKVHVKKEAPQPAEVIENEKPKADSITRFQKKFRKSIRAMMNEHKEINITYYRAVLRHQKRRLLIEKLKRLEARFAQREGQRS